MARLKPPQWPARSPAARFGDLYKDNPEAAREATYLNARLIAHDLAGLGINVDCLPVLDVPVPGAHDIIGDRAFRHRSGHHHRLGQGPDRRACWTAACCR